VDTLLDLLLPAIGASPFALLALYVWWSERQERRKLTQDMFRLLEDMVGAPKAPKDGT